MAEHITVETIRGWVDFRTDRGEPERQLYACQKCGYRWEGQAVQIVGATGEYMYRFPQPQHCISCEQRVLPDQLVANLEGALYRYASQSPGSPSYHTRKEDWADPAAFEWTVREMQKYEIVRPLTVPELIRHRVQSLPLHWEQRYLDVNGFSYWTTAGLDGDISIINRQYSTHAAYETSSFPTVRDSTLADLWHRTVRRGNENESQHYPLARPRGRVLDISCGAGLLVDYCYEQIDRERYVGIDSNISLLSEFALKHPGYGLEATLLRTTFEDYETSLRFDTIVAMGGAASFVAGVDVVAKVHRLLAPGGRALLTFIGNTYVNRDAALLAPTPTDAVWTGGYEVLEFTREPDSPERAESSLSDTAIQEVNP